MTLISWLMLFALMLFRHSEMTTLLLLPSRNCAALWMIWFTWKLTLNSTFNWICKMVVVGGKNLSSSTFDVGLLPASKSPSAQNDCCSGSCSRPPSPANLSIIESLQWKACSVDQEEKMPTFPILICSFRERFQKQKKTTFHLVDVVELAAPLLHALHVRHDPAVLRPEQKLSSTLSYRSWLWNCSL